MKESETEMGSMIETGVGSMAKNETGVGSGSETEIGVGSGV